MNYELVDIDDEVAPLTPHALTNPKVAKVPNEACPGGVAVSRTVD